MEAGYFDKGYNYKTASDVGNYVKAAKRAGRRDALGLKLAGCRRGFEIKHERRLTDTTSSDRCKKVATPGDQVSVRQWSSLCYDPLHDSAAWFTGIRSR